MYRIRKHLANGKYKGFWQIKSKNGVSYFDPYEVTLIMFNCKLKNRRSVAERIYSGERNKSVCAWVECSSVIVAQDLYDSGWCKLEDAEYFEFNPRQNPFWIDSFGDIADGDEFDVLVTDYSQIVDGAKITTSDFFETLKIYGYE